eukprot:CAMPEP_0181066618 /NCGR_PEP_ID=MMETSP1070-20121207/25433_1 /TAXON_ID=265543 /ORGANISM="Minutocellus polymorphus, Strain NH13" /LENGTH=53 /DNA_ID=CAMNT_0023147217 /DNA_START=82 /DNA_END=239 /DNA_ORIENTATION=+
MTESPNADAKKVPSPGGGAVRVPAGLHGGGRSDPAAAAAAATDDDDGQHDAGG